MNSPPAATRGQRPRRKGVGRVGHWPLAGGGESRRALRASNDPEVTMSNAATNTNLIAHTKALEAPHLRRSDQSDSHW